MKILWDQLTWPPNFSSYGLEDVSTYFNSWKVFILALAGFVFLMLLVYYFITKPTQKALIRFWIFGGIIFSASIIVPIIYILISYKKYEGENLELAPLIFASILSSFLQMTILTLIILFLFLILIWRIPSRPFTNLKAMRRFPFSFIR